MTGSGNGGLSGGASGAAGEVAGTAKEQGRVVADEVKFQARSLAGEARDRLKEQSRGQSERLSGTMHRLADELEEMTSERGGSPASAVVSRIASGSRQAADYLAEQGPEGVLREVQDFARRRPGAFVATALVAGFVVGRLGKSVWSAGESSDGGDVSTGGVVNPVYGGGYDASGYAAGGYAGAGAGVDAGAGTTYAATGSGYATPVAGETAPVWSETTPVAGAAAPVDDLPGMPVAGQDSVVDDVSSTGYGSGGSRR